MSGFLKYMIPVWATGIAVAFAFALNLGGAKMSQDRTDALSDVSKQATSVRIALENLAEKSANELTRIIESELVAQEVTAWLSNSQFESVALVGKDASGAWNVEWSKATRGGVVKGQYEKWLPNLPLERVQGDTLSWNRVEVPNQRPKLLLGVQLRVKSSGSDSLKVALGALPIDYLSSLTEPLKTEGSEIFLVDGAGFSLTFPDARYLGSRVEVHPVVSQLLRMQKMSDYGDYRNLTGQNTVGGYERAKNSNVYVIVNQAVVSKVDAFREILVRSALVCLGVLLIGSLIVVIIHWRERAYQRQLEERVALAPGGASTTPSASAPPTSLPPANSSEVLEKLGLTFFSYLRGPVYAALGQIHILREKISEKPLLENLDVLEGEIRRTRDFIEGLNRTLKLESRPSESVDLCGQIESAAAKHRDVMARRSVDYEFVPHVNTMVRASKEDLGFVVGAILDYATKKLAQSADKRKLTVKMEKAGGMVRVLFHLAGYHFNAEEAKTLFDFQKQDATDLALARGFVLSWNGNLVADPSLVGGKIYLELPSLESEPIVAKQPKTQEVAPAPQSAATPPKESQIVDQGKTDVKPVVIPTLPMIPKSESKTTGLPPNILSVPELNLQEESGQDSEEEELEVSRANIPIPEPLLRRRVTEELDRILPPSPDGPAAKPEVSVVSELTATTPTSTQTQTDADADAKAAEDKNEKVDIQIRKPKVRYDI